MLTGTVSVAYVLTFISVKAFKWGVNMSASVTSPPQIIPGVYSALACQISATGGSICTLL